MARNKGRQDHLISSAPFVSEELDIYLETADDFAFELKCFAAVKELGFQCTHGGSYIDRITEKPRQYDIRAQALSDKFQVRCAIECKNIPASHPVLVCCTPRVADEAFHDLILAWQSGDNPWSMLGDRRQCIVYPAEGMRYPCDGPVGKDIKRVARTAEPAEYSAASGDVFDAWSQALASAEGLVKIAAADGMRYLARTLTLVLPIVVVPDDALWVVEFDGNGHRNEPVLSHGCAFYVGHRCDTGDNSVVRLTHIEFVTLSGLCHMLANVLSDDRHLWFPNTNVSVAATQGPTP